MSKHPKCVEDYDGCLKELAEAIGDMQYDYISLLLQHLADKIHKDCEKDRLRGRVKLYSRLIKVVQNLEESKRQMDFAWEICKPYMGDNNE